jgi:hypothetical protein
MGRYLVDESSHAYFSFQVAKVPNLESLLFKIYFTAQD